MIDQFIKRSPIILASGSPRRKEILAGLGLDFQIVVSQVHEEKAAHESPEQYVLRLAQEKAADVAKRFAHGFVIGADTTVVLDDQILEKPLDQNDARRMLSLLQGRWHDVHTGVAVINAANQECAADLCTTRVKFSKLDQQQIDWYLTTGEPFDKAGAYAIQGFGTLFVDQITGNYTNVVGLPVPLLYRLLTSLKSPSDQ